MQTLDHVAYGARSVTQEFDDVKAVGFCQSFECFEHVTICLIENIRVKAYFYRGMYRPTRLPEIKVRLAHRFV